MIKPILKILLTFLIVSNYQAWCQSTTADSSRIFPLKHYKMKADRNTIPSVDHSKFEILKGEFTDAKTR